MSAQPGRKEAGQTDRSRAGLRCLAQTPSSRPASEHSCLPQPPRGRRVGQTWPLRAVQGWVVPPPVESHFSPPHSPPQGPLWTKAGAPSLQQCGDTSKELWDCPTPTPTPSQAHTTQNPQQPQALLLTGSG